MIGPMGCGKTTVGKQLAEKMGMNFIDIDNSIEKKLKVDIATIFAIEGEAGFRKRETDELLLAVKKNHCIISTGGGAVLSKHNRDLLSKNGKVIFLNLSSKNQYNRLKYDKKRPLLKNDNPQKALDEMYINRLPLYKEIADYEFMVDDFAIKDTVGMILQKI